MALWTERLQRARAERDADIKIHIIHTILYFYHKLTEFQKKESWIIPLTADYSVPLPEKKELKIKGEHRIGSRNGISQFITLDTNLKTIKNVQEISIEWTEVYNENIIIFKKNKWTFTKFE